MTLAFKALADESSALALISRYESRLRRMHDRALRSLRELQSAQAEKLPPAPAPQAPAPPSEPKTKNDETNPSPAVEPPAVEPMVKLCAHALPAPERTPPSRAYASGTLGLFRKLSRPGPTLTRPGAP